MNDVLALAVKDLKILIRDRAGLFWILAWPLLFGIFFGAIMGGSGPRGRGRMPLAVIDQDTTAESRAYIERLAKSDALRVETSDLETARKRVQKGDLVGWVLLEPGFGAALGFGSGNPPRMRVGIDPSRRAEKGFLEGLLTQASFAVMQDQLGDRDGMQKRLGDAVANLDTARGLDPERRKSVKKFLGSLKEFLDSPDTSSLRNRGGGFQGPQMEVTPEVRDARQPRTAFEISFPSAILWALIGSMVGFAQSLVGERAGGTFLRLRSTPLTRGRILAGKGLACFVTGLAVLVLMLGFGGAFLGVRISSVSLVAAAGLSAILCFSGLMMLFSCLGKTERAAAGAGRALMLLMMMVGGGMIPLIAMPAWMQSVSNLSPVKWGILALEGAIWRGFTPADMVLPCVILLSVGLMGFVVGSLIFSKIDS